VLALASAWHSGGAVWRAVNAEDRKYAAYTDTQRQDAVLDGLSINGQAFAFFEKYVHRGDRVYFQVPTGRKVNSNLSGAVVAAGSFYLLPAVRTTELKDATVVVSYQVNPKILGARYVSQVRDGQQLFFVSRLAQK